jgi:acyl-CoA thioester hydrolase
LRFIEDKIKINVRFSEVDAMGVVWHGNYLKFFEDARESFGKKTGMSYLDIHKQGYVVPIVKSQLQYKTHISFGDEIEVVSRLIKSKAAKIVFYYEVWNLTTNKMSAEGLTEQVFLNNKTRELELYIPEFYKNWMDKANWKSG